MQAADNAAAYRQQPGQRLPVPDAQSRTFWIGLAVGAVALVAFYGVLTFQRLEIFKMLLSSFFPLLVLILAVASFFAAGSERLDRQISARDRGSRPSASPRPGRRASRP